MTSSQRSKVEYHIPMDEYRKKTGGSGFCAIAAMAVLVVTITLVCGFVLKTQRSTLSEIEAMLKKAEHELNETHQVQDILRRGERDVERKQRDKKRHKSGKPSNTRHCDEAGTGLSPPQITREDIEFYAKNPHASAQMNAQKVDYYAEDNIPCLSYYFLLNHTWSTSQPELYSTSQTLKIPMNGIYNLYAQVTFSGQTGKGLYQPYCNYTIERRRKSSDSWNYVPLMTSYVTQFNEGAPYAPLRGARAEDSVTSSGLFKLWRDDVIEVKTSPNCCVETEPHATFYGATLISPSV